MIIHRKDNAVLYKIKMTTPMHWKADFYSIEFMEDDYDNFL